MLWKSDWLENDDFENVACTLVFLCILFRFPAYLVYFVDSFLDSLLIAFGLGLVSSVCNQFSLDFVHWFWNFELCNLFVGIFSSCSVCLFGWQFWNYAACLIFWIICCLVYFYMLATFSILLCEPRIFLWFAERVNNWFRPVTFNDEL